MLAHLLRTITVFSIALSVTGTAKASATSSRPIEHCRSQSPRRELVCAQRALRRRRGEEHWIKARHSRTLFALTSASYWRARLKFVYWRIRVDRRSIAEARARMRRAAPIEHVALWLCIHRGEGAWNDNTGNGYYGGLQMTSGWGGVARPDLLSPAAQMALAERGLQAAIRRGDELAWLEGQWPNSSPPCLGFA